nr:TIR domain-containing protein [uncultured Desulfobacter sp.]
MWAGERSHSIVRKLKEFLEFVVRGPKDFISDDIEGGRLWRVAIAGQLESSSFGIACLTPDNLRSHWLHFEAGALSKAVGQAHVIPFLIGPETTDVEGPLSDFQMVSSDEVIKKLRSSMDTCRAAQAILGTFIGTTAHRRHTRTIREGLKAHIDEYIQRLSEILPPGKQRPAA